MGPALTHHFFLNHQKPPAAAKLIAGELLPQFDGAQNTQRQTLLAFPLDLPFQGETVLAHNVSQGSGALGSFL